MNPETNEINPEQIKLLVLEDEPDLCEAMVSFLQLEGFNVIGAGTALEAEAMLREQPVDLLIMDVGLPDQDGISWLSQLQDNRSLGLILTTARGELTDRIRGHSAGADAYLVKPVELEELRLIILNVAARLGCCGDAAKVSWQLNPIRWQLLTAKGQSVRLTRSETQVLEALARSPGKPLPREALVRALGHQPENYDPRRMEILIRRLRTKVSEQTDERLPLETVHGVGYAFTADIRVGS
ncbi:TorCAD operon transcriptional regulatory protein TorR [Thiorhodovibrio winogradskyi]|uniref:TorCAD operon transcriptional regulatory protein TorR n=1 Tax=Thiorhodovibrio winogradskyi TaxID=77007 RepID=A0ABZ0SI24_9GAMM|nr:response regulator transcription factor [Thiorhodovibrio winogradskyi]